MSIRLSVIMPVHGGARHLGATLASAAAEAPGPEVEFRLYNSLDDGGAARAASLSLLVQNAIAIPSPLIRRSAWAAAGGMDEALWYTADWDLYLKLLAHGDMAVRPMATTAFRLHGGSLTMQGRHQAGAMEQQHAAVLARHLPLLAPVPPAVEQRARASAALNCALAGASAGRLRALAGALLRLAALGPLGMAHYMRESRIAERVWPRLRLALAGGM